MSNHSSSLSPAARAAYQTTEANVHAAFIGAGGGREFGTAWASAHPHNPLTLAQLNDAAFAAYAVAADEDDRVRSAGKVYRDAFRDEASAALGRLAP